MQKVQGCQDDLAWGRRYFRNTWELPPTDHEYMMMVVYMNVCNGFVPQGCLPMQIASVGLLTMKKYKYSMDISAAAVHVGVLPEIVLCSVKRLMEFLKGHIRAGDQKTTLRGALKS